MLTKLQAINYSQWNSLHPKPKIILGIHPTPWGNCIISQAENALCGLTFQNLTPAEALDAARLTFPEAQVHCNEEATAHWIPIVTNYLQGVPPNAEYTLLLLGTPFQLSIWTALLEIPKAQVVSYQDIANRVGRPKAVRAVGTAIGKNKISLLVPCHRVIQSSGGLGGYAWGLGLKQTLLDYEARFKQS